MSYSEPARTTTRRIPRILVAVLLGVIAAIAAGPGHELLASSSSTAASHTHVARSTRHALGERPAAPELDAPGERRAPPELDALGERDSAGDGALGEADGAVPDGTTVFDDDVPGVAKLDPALLGALRQAATDAAGDGVQFVVDSGWRSPAYQEHLLQQAISEYGSEAEAARVATPATSPHVSGNAVDIGPSAATAWLSAHGAEYGLCQIYGNEPWHYELRPEAIASGCPAMYADPTDDPRMQQ
jgi:D-alanyl-D-alanine carboxypeptidase